MSHQSEQLNGTPQTYQQGERLAQHDQSHPNPQKIQIQVTTKKKKQVISLDSSSEKNISPQVSPQKPVISSAPKESKKVKVKKIQHKCQLCKGSGKKVQMKKCLDCKFYTHIHCLDQNQGKGKFICDKCKAANAEEIKVVKKQKKQEQKIQLAKTTQKKIQKQKKKDESNRVLEKFKEKYSYYIGEGDKIKFPIEDKLLFIYREYFESSESKVMPTDHSLIPSKYLGDLLQIQNFIVSFSDEFQDDYKGDYRKSILFVLMNCNGPDKTFQRILGAIIKIYLKDIFQKNKTQNVKILNDNSFFILLGTINETQQMSADYVALTAPQIIRNLSYIPSLKNSFKDFTFPEQLNLQTKVKILLSLIQGLSQVDAFHDMVSRKSQKIGQMTKNKADYVTKLKKNQAEALSNKQKLKQMLMKVNKLQGKGEQPQQQFREKDKNAIRQAEKTKKKTQKLASEGQVSQRIIKQFKSKILNITKQIPFVISQIIFLGSDRNDSHYFFYLRQPNRIYVRYRNYLLDNNEQFKIFESKQKIVQFLKSLNTKGVHEKRLYQSINNLLKDQTIRNLTIQDEYKQIEGRMGQPMDDCVFLESDSQFRQKVINDVMEIQQKFSNYLAIKNYRWASESKREQFRFGFPYIQDLTALKEQIKSLQESFLFVQVIRERQMMREQSESNQQNQRQLMMPIQKQSTRRKKPIRIWGINSERIKRFWVQYLQTCVNYTGVWISVNIFKSYVDKYIDKKMDYIKDQEKKQNQQRQRQLKQKKLRQQKEKDKQQRNLQRLRSNKPKLTLRNQKETQSVSPAIQEQSPQQGIKTRRKLRATNRSKNRPLTIDSDDEPQQQDYSQQNEEESQNQDECDICKDTGEVICCDTCPKVFHLGCLGLKQTPQGQWSCMDCLYKINNERQTRSRAKKMGR